MKVYFATMTGNAELLASSMVKKAQISGLDATLVDIGEVNPTELITDKCAVFIVSTWGKGQPPEAADVFWKELNLSNFDLSQMQYAVFGLGDRDHAEFNGFARSLDERLCVMKARSFLFRVDADVDYDDDFDHWEAQVFEFVELVSKSRKRTSIP